ncbi:MAG TPA: RNA polymerase sigma factor [Steroidobacteraceae bacterium]|nr:RNA polymerase sigma factor [Steroidobacteraceae bacterium]
MLTLLKPWAEPDAFHAVLNERSGRWYNACLRITRDADLAADAVQEALLKAWDRRDEFRGDAALDSWIHRIALNAAIDLTRKRKRRAEEELEDDAHEAPPIAAPEAEYTTESFGKDLGTALQRLSNLERQTFLLKHIEGWKLEEIAESTRSNINNVKSTLFRAVRKLRVDLHVWRSEP